MTASECDVLIMGPRDATGRLLRALLQTEGFAVRLARTRLEAMEAARSPLLTAIVVHAPAVADSKWIRDLLRVEPFASRLLIRMEEATPEALEAIARTVSQRCRPLSP